ncbi:hypothetical protein BDW74DRAFT_151685 [Aspergillus multicolor]|uniref:protein-serine/threonine phosphatase n=1 Tax=Aspergillus multicolor TaxID=41759 RepID=UPI003CCD4F8C
MLLRLPPSLHYPITVTSLLKEPGDEVERNEALFWYVYETTVTEGDGWGNKVDVKRSFPTRFESTVDGNIVHWKISKGDVIDGPVDVIEIDEPCAHEVQYGGLCAECGKDMTEATYNTETTDSMRAPIQMTHDNTALTVSEREAVRVEEDAKRRLLANRKLSLVVDLDQTIIQAACDPTVGVWMADKDSPNHAAVSDVRAFQLVEDGPVVRGCWYYIKLRPGLEEFLENVSEMYELHIYTMGTRSYAQAIAGIIDPDRKLFGDRILSRDESGSLSVKNLHRLFPVDTKMVVIIDDRGDVWRWSPNLIKVIPYDFFVGCGDINSSFLPKKQDELEAPGENQEINPTPPVRSQVNGSTEGSDATEISTLEQLVTMGGGDNPRLLQEQTEAQDETILHQVEDRPLLQRQKELDAEDESADSSESSVDESQVPEKPRHILLVDNDQELIKLSERLEQVHRKFYDEYDKKRARGLGGRVAALRGEKAISKEKDVDLKLVPDVKDILPAIKRRVMVGVFVAHSGLWKLNEDIANIELAQHARTFGVVFENRITHKTTHLLSAGKRTEKFRQAVKNPRIKIVWKQWLIDCLLQWKRLDEGPYLVPTHPEEQPSSKEVAESSWISTSDEEASGGSLTDTEDASELNDEILKSAGITELGFDQDEEAAVHDELKEFLGSDDESESDTEASWLEQNERPPTSNPELKRKRDDEVDIEEENNSYTQESGDAAGSRLSQRIKRSYERSTGLKEVASASISGPSSNPDATATAPSTSTSTSTDTDTVNADADDNDIPDVAFPETEEEAASSRNPDSTYPEDPAEDDDELEREMLAAFEEGGYDSNVEEAISEEDG